MRHLKFTKMQGAGNDFVVINALAEPFDLTPMQLRALADRRFGVGADQILVVEPAPYAGVDFRYRIFNADGGEVQQCGNGARCFARYVVERGLASRPVLRVVTLAGEIELRVQADGGVTVDMGQPVTALAAIPMVPDFAGTASLMGSQPWFELSLPAELATQSSMSTVRFAPLSMGNPHAVMVVADVDAAPVEMISPWLQQQACFPEQVNVGWMEIVDRHQVRLRVYERGAGETLACGTGACAAAVVGLRSGLLDTPVQVHARGGELRIEWSDLGSAGSSVLMTGPAVTVFEGEITL